MRIPVAWRVAYGAVGGLVAFWFFLRGIVTRDPERRCMYRERLGRWDRPDDTPDVPCLWLHAASVGEVGLATAVIERLRHHVGELRVLLTCNTSSGRAQARRSGADEVRYLPVDFAPIVRRVASAVRPSVFAFVETEIWPGLLAEMAARSVPAAMLNARISAKSYPRYLRIRPLIEPALASLVRICARDPVSAERLRALGAEAAVLEVLGDAKLDAIDADVVESTRALLAPATGERPVLLAISTHPGEEKTVLEAYGRLRDAGIEAALVIAPRHPERAAAVADEVEERWQTRLWSASGPSGAWDVLIVDTTGDVRGFAKSANAAFVGGSFVPVGGHNLFEPAAFGVPIAAGPFLDEVAAQAETLTAAGCLEIVDDASALATVWRHWLESPQTAATVGEACRRTVVAHGGALERTVAELRRLLRQRGIHVRAD